MPLLFWIWLAGVVPSAVLIAGWQRANQNHDWTDIGSDFGIQGSGAGVDR